MRSLLTRFSLMGAVAAMAVGLTAATAIGATVVPYAPGMYAANSGGMAYNCGDAYCCDSGAMYGSGMMYGGAAGAYEASAPYTPYASGGLYSGGDFTQQGLLPSGVKRFGKLYFDGWVSGGGATNNAWPMTAYAPTSRGDTGEDDAGHAAGMNQLYVILGRELTKGGGADFGLRADLLYGTDYMPVTSLGLEQRDYRTTVFGEHPVSTVYQADPRWNINDEGGHPEYGVALPQVYGELYLPVAAGLTVKAGHFYSPLGYESFPAPCNFFYSHSYTMLYAEAQTLTGALGELAFDNNFSILAGYSQGWDEWTDNNGHGNIMGGFTMKSCDETASLAFIMMTGKEIVDHETVFHRTEGVIRTYSEQVSNYSLVFQKKLTPGLTYVLQHDLGAAQDGAYSIYDNIKTTDNAYWYSVVNYLYWQMASNFTLGFRAEWMKDQGYSRIWGGPSSDIMTYKDAAGNIHEYGYRWTGDNFIDLALGINWNPTDWLTLRPEVRWDYSDMERIGCGGVPDAKGVYDHLTENSLVTFGGDVICRF